MSRIVVVENVSLDGVMQAPGRCDEDSRGGFDRGGWALPYDDPVKFEIMGKGMANAGPMLFGRRTYEDFFRIWAGRTDNPFSPVLDAAQKYVASATLVEPLPWKNSTLLGSNTADAVARIKSQPGKDIVVLGSGALVRSLARRHLVDEYVLLIHPLVLGRGRRLFEDDGVFTALDLTEVHATTTGVMIATYRQAQGMRSNAVRGGSDEAISAQHLSA